MVRKMSLALSGAALITTASSFLTPSRTFHVPEGIVNCNAKVKLSPATPTKGVRRGRWAMSSVSVDGVGGERYYGPTSKPLLDSVQSPADMKRFSLNELKQLAYELRWETLEVSNDFSGVVSQLDAASMLGLQSRPWQSFPVSYSVVLIGLSDVHVLPEWS